VRHFVCAAEKLLGHPISTRAKAHFAKRIQVGRLRQRFPIYVYKKERSTAALVENLGRVEPPDVNRLRVGASDGQLDRQNGFRRSADPRRVMIA